MRLLIKSEKDLGLIKKDKFGEKLDQLDETITLSFARKIDNDREDIKFSDDAQINNSIKVEFGSVKDHLLSKIREAKDVSFYNSLEGYFREYFRLIKFKEEGKRMKQEDFENFMKRIDNLKKELSIVYEPIYPEEYKGYTLREVDRTTLDEQPSGTISGILLKEDYNEELRRYNGNYEEVTEFGGEFTGIKKHSQIRYIGGREYYFSGGEYGAIYLQDVHDADGAELGEQRRRARVGKKG